MKRSLIKILIITMVVSLYACGYIKEDQEHSKTENIEESEDHNPAESGLSLDNGKPWTANPETTTGVNNMIELMNSFTDKDNADSYGTLTENLKQEYAMIFAKCTMTGEAHNQLHIFLVPMNDLFEGLDSKDLNRCKESYSKMNEHLADYKNYFQ